MGQGIHKNKNWYQRELSRLKHQRDAIREGFKFKQGVRAGDWYKRAIEPYNKKIRTYQKQIQRFEKWEVPVKLLASAVKNFTGKGLFDNSSSMTKEAILGRYLFYKAGLEQGIHARHLIQFTGASRCDTAHRARLTFTRSFRTNPENKKVWMQFKQFIEIRLQEAA